MSKKIKAKNVTYSSTVFSLVVCFDEAGKALLMLIG
jgi:hypothetical protein